MTYSPDDKKYVFEECDFKFLSFVDDRVKFRQVIWDTHANEEVDTSFVKNAEVRNYDVLSKRLEELLMDDDAYLRACFDYISTN